MGCASSRPRRCRHCHHEPYSPVPRSYSAHRQSYDRAEKGGGDCYHVVALKSSTLGSLKLDLKNQENRVHGGNNLVVADRKSEVKGNEGIPEKKGNESPVELIKAKVWLEMKEDEEVIEITKIETKTPVVEPKTPVTTPPGEPETINAWELMEGLEDDAIASPLRSLTHSNSKSFSFDTGINPASFLPKSNSPENAKISPAGAPMWLQMSEKDQNQSIPLENEKIPNSKSIKDRVIIYFTSLRGIRKTYEDSCHVRVILKGLGIRLDERDVSLHSGFKEELKELMGDDLKSGLGLPKVFLGKKYIGGADEIRRLNEDGNLEKLFQGCEIVEESDGGTTENGCEGCGDIRFVPCETCSGSCKVFYDGDEEGEEGEYGFQRCPDCNENGLIRCPVCWD